MTINFGNSKSTAPGHITKGNTPSQKIRNIFDTLRHSNLKGSQLTTFYLLLSLAIILPLIGARVILDKRASPLTPPLTPPFTPPLTPIKPTSTPNPLCPKKSWGDADCNGKININDFGIWKDEFINKNGLRADFDGKNGVTIIDFGIWKVGFLSRPNVTVE